MKPRQAKNLANELMYPMLDFQTNMDIYADVNRLWLGKLGLWDFASLQWDQYAQNIYAPTQLTMLQNSEAVIGKEREITPAFFAEQFSLPNEGSIEWEKANGNACRIWPA